MESSVSSELHDLVRSLRSRKSPRMGCTHSRVFSLHDDVRARSARTPTLFSPLAILEILAILAGLLGVAIVRKGRYGSACGVIRARCTAW